MRAMQIWVLLLRQVGIENINQSIAIWVLLLRYLYLSKGYGGRYARNWLAQRLFWAVLSVICRSVRKINCSTPMWREQKLYSAGGMNLDGALTNTWKTCKPSLLSSPALFGTRPAKNYRPLPAVQNESRRHLFATVLEGLFWETDAYCFIKRHCFCCPAAISSILCLLCERCRRGPWSFSALLNVLLLYHEMIKQAPPNCTLWGGDADLWSAHAGSWVESRGSWGDPPGVVLANYQALQPSLFLPGRL